MVYLFKGGLTLAMMRYNIKLPPIRDDMSGYFYLSRLSDAVISNPDSSYVFYFENCSTISHNGLAVIGGLCNYITQHHENKNPVESALNKVLGVRKVGFNIDNISQKVMEKITDCGFWNYIKPEYGISFNSKRIGYREHETVLEDSQIINHLRDNWITNDKIAMSDALKEEVVSSIYEIFVNAYGHGLKDNPLGKRVISCGNYDQKSKELSLSVLDFGGGIVNSVQGNQNIHDKKIAFEWALKNGNSTRTDSPPDLPRGLGFGILKEFVKVNQGNLIVVSDEYLATVGKNGEYSTVALPGHFHGTMVNITVKCDNRYYKLRKEPIEESNTYF